MHDAGVTDSRGLDFRQAYAADAELRRSLSRLVSSILPEFGPEFFESRFFDPTFTPFSFFDHSTCVANVAVFDLPLALDGSLVRAGGVQLVATHPAYRGRGLFAGLMRRAIAYCDQRFETTLLFTSIPGRYVTFEFRTVSDDIFVAQRWPAMATGIARQLDAGRDDDLRLLDRLVSTREPVSAVLGVPAHRATFFGNEMRHRLARVHYVEELDAAMVWDAQGQTVRLLDIVARQMPTLVQVAPYLPVADSLEIWFTPDRLDIESDVRPRAFDDVLMVRGQWPIEHLPFGFPPTAYF